MTKLNIYLLKENVTDEQVLKLIPGVTKVECLKENARIYTYTPSSSVPKWVTPYFGTVYEDLKIKHVGVINIVDVEIDGRIVSFLLSFGSTKAVVNNSCIVENFGMKTLLSSSDKFNFKNLVVYGCADNKKKFNTQLSSADNIFDFGVDVINNLITKITASVPDDENLKYTMVGSDSLNLSSKNCLDDIEELLIKLYEYYISDKYVSKYKFIDNIRLVNDKHIKEKLNQELLNILNKSLKEDDYSLVEMITPVLIDWENISGYSYIRGKIYDELDLKTFFRDKKVKEVTSSTLESTIKLISSEDESIIDSWKLYKCLFLNINMDDYEYYLNAGKWYRVNPNYVEEINTKYSMIPISDCNFIDWNISNNENQYNKLLSANLTNSEVLDCNNINISGEGNSKIEVCDVVFEKSLICVKKYTSAASISHLSQQGVTACKLLTNKEFRMQVNDKLSNQLNKFDLDNYRSNEYSLIYAIGTKHSEELPKVSFFQKLLYVILMIH